ncbi:bifunctional diguanylate cyclase/phosphodiesterase [Sulfitobacter sp.]|uniref:bifunctional diguanylate cyclase/phosphodiesterase n=1 Tax=Sulfitobacter sp. TaxID=1903071 RepID=UPI003001A90B
MNKIVIQKAINEDKVGWAKGLNSISMDPEFLGQVADGMEQGVLVWDANGLCTMYTDRVFDVLEMRPANLYVGIERSVFLDGALSRGELDQGAVDKTQECFSRKTPFQFDRLLRSGRIISTAARPLVDGGYVVTFTDVTQQRQESTDLVAANEAAELAQTKLLETLEKEKLRQYEASMLAELGDWLQTCKSLNELYIVLKEYMRQMIGDSRGELYIYSNSRDVLDGVISWGETDIHDHIKADACWALRRGRNYSFSPQKISFDCSHVQDQETPSSEDYICVPIIAHGDTVGLLHIQFLETTSKEKCLRRPHQFAAQCGELISLAIANVKLRDELHHQSTRDPLTGLFNRRHFLESLRNELKLQARKSGSFGVISFDADKFKLFNDNHGHDAGDMVLRAISDAMGTFLSADEVLCRYGGEEFMVLLPAATHDQAIQVAEVLRERIQDLSISYVGRILPTVTISCGVASYPYDGSQIQDILKNADDALYRAKKDGRNRVVDSSALRVGKTQDV